MSVDKNIAELIIEKYAEQKGISKEEARKKYLPILLGEEKEGKYSKIAQKLLSVAEILSSIKDVAENADPATKSILTGLGASLVSNVAGNTVDDAAEYIKPVMRMVAQLKAIEAAFSSGSKDVETLKDELSKLREEIQEYRRKEQLEETKKIISEEVSKRDEVIGQLVDTVNKLMDEIQSFKEKGEKPKEDEETILKKVETVKEKSMKLLRDLGYEVKPTTLTREEVEELIKQQVTNLPPDELKKILEKHGYKVVGGPIPYDKALEMVEEARKKAYDEALEDKRIDAVKDIVSQSVSQIIQLFKPAIETIFTRPEEAPKTEQKESSE